jgi:hypothetical protein
MSLATKICREQYLLDKDDFEGIIVDLHGEDKTRILTQGEWEAIAKEIVGRVDNFLDNLLQEVVDDYLDGGYTD